MVIAAPQTCTPQGHPQLLNLVSASFPVFNINLCPFFAETPAKCSNFAIFFHRFFLDIAFYSQNLFIPNVLTYINYIQAIDLPAAGYFQQSVSPRPLSVLTKQCHELPATVMAIDAPVAISY